MSEQILQHTYKIWLFSEIVKEGHFKKVASKLGITPSAISQNIASLESYLQETLLIRHKGHIEVTEAGRQLLDSSDPFIRGILALDKGDQGDGLKLSKLKFGAYESIAVSTLPSLFRGLNEKFPKLKLEVITGRSVGLATQVRQGLLDFAFVTEGIRESGINLDPIGQDTLGVYVSNRFKYSADKLLPIAAVSPGPDGHPLYYQKFIGQLEKSTSTRLVTDSIEALRSLASSGEVAAVLPGKIAGRTDDLQPHPELKITRDGQHDWLLASRKNIPEELRSTMVSLARKVFSNLP